MCLTWRRDFDVFRIRVVGRFLLEPTILAPELGPRSAHVLPLVLSPDRLQNKTVIPDSSPGHQELPLLCSGSVLRAHRQNARRTDAGQFYASPEPGDSEELLLHVLSVQAAGERQVLPLLQNFGLCLHSHHQR